MFIPAVVNIGGIKVNSPDHGSGVNFGTNFLAGNHVTGKKNQGFGQQMADLSLLTAPVGITFDEDTMDHIVINEMMAK